MNAERGAPSPPRTLLLILAAVAYLPALFSSPGRMPADTKLYLYLDPGRLTKMSVSTWDPSQFGGWVPHQMTTYLWPSGPWFVLFDTIGAPDWIAHRLWIATLLFMGGWGVLRLARLLGLSAQSAIVAALVYQLSTYLLPYISRTSVMLLPWAALGWLTILTIHSVRQGGWRYPALFGLVILTVAHVNPTAFLMIVPGPLLWVAIESASKRVTARQVITASARLGLVAIGVSMWWIVMLGIQSRYGADVLGFSETLESVSASSSAPEVVRGLGYWLFYIRDPYAPTTAASLMYQSSPALIVVGFALTMTCLAGLVATRWQHRSYAIGLVLIGVILAVGVHPNSDPSPVMEFVGDSRLALALRSSTRALPLMVLGLGLGAGALVQASAPWRLRQRAITIGLLALVVINVPSVWRANLVDAGLERDQSVPAAWADAAAALDQGDTDARVLQFPGAEFGAYRWGYTVDPPLPYLTDKPLLTRDLLPLGSPGVMDLFYALDNRIQSGTLDTRSLAPVARLLGADQIWLANDQAFDRFQTPRPEPLNDLLTGPVDGLGNTVSFGEPTVNQPDIPIIDEQSLSDPRIGTALPSVELRSVTDPAGMVRLVNEVVILDGSGDGVVDAAAAGLLTGTEALIYGYDLDRYDDALQPAARYIVTDSNRDRDEQWRGSQDVTGMTESGGPGSDTTITDDSHRRLPRNRSGESATQTIATLDGGVRVTASTYGEPFAFLPEARAAMAVDGDLDTAWRVGVRGNPIGQSITVSSVDGGVLQLVQPRARSLLSAITAVDIDAGGTTQRVELGPESLTSPGQAVAVAPGVPVTITIVATAPRPDAPATGEAWVGFAELGPTTTEFVRPPEVVLPLVRPTDDLAIVFSRDRVRATNRWRSDPEPRLARRFTLPSGRSGNLTVTVRLNGNAVDVALDGLAGVAGGATSNGHLTGVPGARAGSAFDADPTTWWASPFHSAIGSRIEVPIDPTAEFSSLQLVQPLDAGFAQITQVRVTVGDATYDATLEPDAGGAAAIELPPVTGERLSIEVLATDQATTIDRRYGETTLLPVAISSIIGAPTLIASAPQPPSCRQDLLTVDGAPVGLTVDTAALLAGEAVQATLCDGATLQLEAGEHTIVSTPGRSTAIDVDLLVWDSPGPAPETPSLPTQPSVVIGDHSSTEWSAVTDSCPAGCWLVFGQGYNEGWSATDQNSGDLGPSRPMSGGFNGWWLEPSDGEHEITFTFAPQGRLNVALLISLLATVTCLALALAPLAKRRRRAPALGERRSDDEPEPAADDAVDASADDLIESKTAQSATSEDSSDGVGADVRSPVIADRAADMTLKRAIVAGVALALVSALFVAPVWTLAGLAAGVALVATRRSRLVALTGIAVLALVTAVVVRRQIVYGYEPGGAWPSNFDDLHRLTLFAILLVGVAIWSPDGDKPEPASASSS